MKVLADHCVPQSIVEAVRSDGHRVIRVVDAIDPAATDRSVAALAALREAVLLTADSDFGRRKDFDPRRGPGIILMKDLHAAPDRVLRRLLRLLANDGEARLAGTLVVLDRRSARRRR